MIDIAGLQNSFDAIPSASYGVARQYYPMFYDLLTNEVEASGLNNWINMGNSSYQGSVQKLKDSMVALGSDINDTSSHAPDDDYANWGGFKSLAMQLAIESNAIEEGLGVTISNNIKFFTTDLPQSVADLPQTLADAAPWALGGLGIVAVAAVGLAVLFLVKR